VIGGFYIGEHCCILHALGSKKENLAVFNLADFCNSPNHQNKFYAKFSSYMVVIYNVTSFNLYHYQLLYHLQEHYLMLLILCYK